MKINVLEDLVYSYRNPPRPMKLALAVTVAVEETFTLRQNGTKSLSFITMLKKNSLNLGKTLVTSM